MKLLKFYADWCGPCKEQSKLLEGFNEIEITSINVEDEDKADLVNQLRVMNLPTMVIVDDENKELKRFIGVTPISKISNSIKELKE